jgi:hypothetical protein
VQSLLLFLVLLAFCLCFFTRLGRLQAQASRTLPMLPPPAEAPHHANGRAMTIREVHIWRSMQHTISAHWPEFSAPSDWTVRTYQPADRYWGSVIQVYGMGHVALRSDMGDWEAEISSEGRVGAPHEKV